jgi:uncharacterized cupin superfamily protein
MSSLVVHGQLDATGFRPISPEEGGWEPLEGDSNARVHDFCLTEDVWSGVALVDPCRFTYEPDHPGMIQVVDGAATVTTEGRTLELGPGDVLVLSPGARTSWEITSPLREFFFAALSPEATG